MGQILADKNFVNQLLSLEAEAATGILRVRAEGICTEIHLHNGVVVFAAGGLPSDSVGRELVRRGLLTVADYIQVVEKRMSVGGRRKFGDVALELKLIDEEGLVSVLNGQVRHKVARGLHWDNALVEFEPTDEVMPDPAGGGVSAVATINDAARSHYGSTRMKARIGDAWEQMLTFIGLQVIDSLGLDEQDLKRVMALRNGKTPAEIATSPEDGQHVAKLLIVLWLVGVIELPAVDLDGVETAAPEEDEDVFEVGLAGEVGVRSSRDRLLADSAFLQGRELFTRGEYGAAGDAFETASSLRSHAREYALALAWSRYLERGGDEDGQVELSALCDAALAQDRHLSLAYHVRASLALHNGDGAAAKEDLSKAVLFDPSDEVSARMLQDLGAA